MTCWLAGELWNCEQFNVLLFIRTKPSNLKCLLDGTVKQVDWLSRAEIISPAFQRDLDTWIPGNVIQIGSQREVFLRITNWHKNHKHSNIRVRFCVFGNPRLKLFSCTYFSIMEKHEWYFQVFKSGGNKDDFKDITNAPKTMLRK